MSNWEEHNLEQQMQKPSFQTRETLHIYSTTNNGMKWWYWITEHSRSQVPKEVFVRTSYQPELQEHLGYSVDIWSNVNAAMRLTLCSPLTLPLCCSTSVLFHSIKPSYKMSFIQYETNNLFFLVKDHLEFTCSCCSSWPDCLKNNGCISCFTPHANFSSNHKLLMRRIFDSIERLGVVNLVPLDI